MHSGNKRRDEVPLTEWGSKARKWEARQKRRRHRAKLLRDELDELLKDPPIWDDYDPFYTCDCCHCVYWQEELEDYRLSRNHSLALDEGDEVGVNDARGLKVD